MNHHSITNMLPNNSKQTTGDENKRRIQKERMSFSIILSGTDSALVGRAWLILNILMTAVFHAYVKRNKIHSDADVENFDQLQLLDDIINDFEDRFDAEEDETAREKIRDTINALNKTRKSRNKICHNEHQCDLAHFKKWTQAWLKSATALLSDSPAYKRTAKETAQDAQRLQKLKKATLALQYPQGNNQIMREAFQFALVDTKYAKAARGYFILATIVHPALKECVASCAYQQGREENKDITALLSLLCNDNQTTFLRHKDLLKIEKLFFGKTGGGSPKDADGNGVKETRNILAHNTKCSSRPDSEYKQMVLIWRRLLIELNSDQHYKNMLDDGAKYLLNIGQEDLIF
jgi:hypothetical protein